MLIKPGRKLAWYYPARFAYVIQDLGQQLTTPQGAAVVALQQDFRQKSDIRVWFYYRDHLCEMLGSYYRVA